MKILAQENEELRPHSGVYIEDWFVFFWLFFFFSNQGVHLQQSVVSKKDMDSRAQSFYSPQHRKKQTVYEGVGEVGVGQEYEGHG